jgi:hypothetical protein
MFCFSLCFLKTKIKIWKIIILSIVSLGMKCLSCWGKNVIESENSVLGKNIWTKEGGSDKKLRKLIMKSLIISTGSDDEYTILVT